MYKSKTPWLYPLIIVILATGCRVLNFVEYFPDSETDINFWNFKNPTVPITEMVTRYETFVEKIYV